MTNTEAVQRVARGEAAMVALGERLARACAGGGVVYLNGELGAGKTTLCRGILRAFGHRGAVKSPTYTLVEPYEVDGRRIYHFDLYRLADPEELAFIGVRDYFLPEALCLVEWPERGAGELPGPDLTVDIRVQHANERALTLTPASERGHRLIAHYQA